MEKGTSQNIRLGIFVVAGILILILGLYFIGENRNLFGKTIRLYASFQNVNGLQTGNNVRYAGIDVGTVKKIEILNDTMIKVSMDIGEKLKGVIRKNSITSIGTDGLMGNTLLNIDPGTSASPLVNDGDELESLHPVNTDAMLRTLQYTNSNIATISANLKFITDNIYKSRGTLYAALMDSTLADHFGRALDNIELVSQNLVKTTNDFSSIASDLKEGKGFMGTLIKDTVMTQQLQQSVAEIKSSSERINTASADLQSTMQKINSGDGTVATMLNDTATANKLKRSIADIEKSAHNFNENMIALQHSFLLRGYFKKEEKKERKAAGK
jgi:phospholipid/cholesterol/gamma-HCH transport system substrate-binding protein